MGQGRSPGGGGQPDPLEAAGVILYRRAADGAARFLLLETAKGGHYSPPKGHLDPGETFEAAALRETLEECGLRPRALDPDFRVEIRYGVVKKGRARPKRVVYFLGEAEEGEVVLSDEHLSACWAPVEEALRLIRFDSLREVVQKASQRIAHTTFRIA